MKHLSEFIHSLDLVRARPLPSRVTALPAHAMEAVFGVPDEDICIYLADERELDEEGVGQPIAGELGLDLPAAEYRVAAYDPKTGVFSPYTRFQGGPGVTLEVPAFTHDLLIRIKKAHRD